MEEGLKIKNLNKSYKDLTVFSNFSISFATGSINCILGPSGCGKTTLLNIIGGLDEADEITENPFTGYKISCVFQEPRLLPWKTALENLVFTLKDILPVEKLYDTAYEYLRLVELEKFSAYFPHKLSGGMKQRLSLARAFSFPSDLILMDEPFKALDIKLKNSLMERFLELWKKDRRTAIFVTHDVDEAIRLGSNIRVLSEIPTKIIGEFNDIENQQKLKDDIVHMLNQ